MENNKMIAEFMGAKILKKGQEAYDMEDKFPNGKDRLMPNKMEYRTSWDWLMPVVDKIESLGFQTKIYCVYSHSIHTDEVTKSLGCGIKDITESRTMAGLWDNSRLVCGASAKTKLEGTYNAIVKFIKAYDEQKKAYNEQKVK
jgi:S-ribosylhomocysteine lyase LuxS involved in autoinducer biosynthesis